MIGWAESGGVRVTCLSAPFHIDLDEGDAAYWASLGYEKMARASRERARLRRLLIGARVAK